jgi:hypothetical protein
MQTFLYLSATRHWLIYEINPRWAVAAGAQVIAPTATNGVASDAREEVTGAVVRVMLPELSEGGYFAPQVRYGVDYGGNDEGPLLRQLRLMATPVMVLTSFGFEGLVPTSKMKILLSSRRPAQRYLRSPVKPM